MRRLIQAAAASGLATGVLAAAGLVRVKLYAVVLGPEGTGVVAQVQNLVNLLAVAAMLGIGVGLSRELARSRGAADAEAMRASLATARAVTLGVAAALALAVGLAARPLAALLLDRPERALLLMAVAPAVVLLTAARVHVEAWNGFRAYHVVALHTVITGVISLAVAVPLIVVLGVPGAILGIVASAAVSLLVCVPLMRRAAPVLRGAGIRPRRGAAGVLLRVGACSLAVGAADQLALLAVRARLIAIHGEAANGWFQGVWGLSQYLLHVVLAYLSGYTLARVHEARDRDEVRRETDQAIRVTLLLVAPAVSSAVLFRVPLIRIFLSEAFRPAEVLFPWQAAGDLLRALGMALGFAVLAVAPARTWMAVGLAGPVVFLGAFVPLSVVAGLRAAPMAYAAGSAVYLAAGWTVLQRRGAVRLQPGTWRAAVAAVALVAVSIGVAVRRPAPYVLGALLLAAWPLLAVPFGVLQGALRAAIRRGGGPISTDGEKGL